MVEWDNEHTYSEVKSKWFVGNLDPSVGDNVKVKEGGSKKKIFSGTVIKKGILENSLSSEATTPYRTT